MESQLIWMRAGAAQPQQRSRSRRKAAACVSTSECCCPLYVCVQSIHYPAFFSVQDCRANLQLEDLYGIGALGSNRDTAGSCLPDLAAAQAESVLSARELMSQSIVGDGRFNIERRFEIADYEGKTVEIVPFREAVR